MFVVGFYFEFVGDIQKDIFKVRWFSLVHWTVCAARPCVCVCVRVSTVGVRACDTASVFFPLGLGGTARLRLVTVRCSRYDDAEILTRHIAHKSARMSATRTSVDVDVDVCVCERESGFSNVQ